MNSDMNNADVLAVLARKDRIKRKRAVAKRNVASLTRRLGTAQRALAKSETELEVVSFVSEVLNGVAISVVVNGWIYGIWIEAVASDIGRCAHVYKNAQSGKTWGLSVQDRMSGREKFLGANWPTRKSAVDAGKTWVACGTIVES